MPSLRVVGRYGLALLLLAVLGAGPALAESSRRRATGSRPGVLKISYKKTGNRDLQAMAKVLKEEKVFDIALPLAAQLRLPQDLPVSFEECGEQNAYYDTGTRSITMCYELFTQLGEMFADPDSTDEEVGEAILGAAFFIFLHEFGHALVHLLDLPITGKEEDAVDDFPTLVLINAGEEAAAAAAISHFGTLAEEYESGRSEDLAFWDEHSLNAQRVYGITCLIYGSDPEAYAVLAGEDGLPEARAARCPEEYKQKSRSWDKLLAPHLAEP
jgi:hypothetical protein